MTMTPPDAPRLGIDLGGTKIEIVALGADGLEKLRRRVPTPQGDYEGMLEAVAALVADAEAALGLPPGTSPIGIGTPGSPSRATGLMRNCNSVWLNGRPLRSDLAVRLRRPVVVANDANCFALSEATDGAAVGADSVFGVILGTGVGGGVVISGRVLEGCNGIAGEWGHNPLPWPDDAERPGPACYCGKRGCIETFLSGPGLSSDHARTSGERLTPEQIVDNATNNSPACAATLERYEARLARALAHVINIVDPDVIVLGGGLSKLDRLFEQVPQRWGEWVFSDQVDTRLVRPRHGDSSGVRGAAWLASMRVQPNDAR
jgi:fructokinase